jgi:hypothetical protein
VEVSHVEVSGVAVEFPVGHTVANHEALKVRDPLARWLGCIDKAIDSQSELRHVNASIGLT